jgi:hypothetical protein
MITNDIFNYTRDFGNPKSAILIGCEDGLDIFSLESVASVTSVRMADDIFLLG